VGGLRVRARRQLLRPPRGLIVLGHVVSEEAGMAWLAIWLRERLPALTVTHLPAGEPLRTR
jgi:hypothetical protein